MDLIKSLIDFLKDRSTSWGRKSAIFISTIALVFFVDVFFEISYNIYLNNRIDQLVKLHQLKSRYAQDADYLSEIVRMEKSIFSSRHYTHRLGLLWTEIKQGSVLQDDPDVPRPSEKQSAQSSDPRSLFWMALSSTYSILFAMLVMIPLPFVSRKGEKGKLLLGTFATLVMCSLSVILATWIAYSIPVIMGNPIWNYILNFSIHTFILVLIVWALDKSNSSI